MVPPFVDIGRIMRDLIRIMHPTDICQIIMTAGKKFYGWFLFAAVVLTAERFFRQVISGRLEGSGPAAPADTFVFALTAFAFKAGEITQGQKYV